MKGFTLIELLLVVAIVLTLSVLASPFYAGFLTQNAVDNTTSQLISSLRKAQTYTMAGKQNNNWGVNYSSSPKQITLYQGTSYASKVAGFDEIFTVNNNISITFNPASPTDVNFARMTGLPSIQPTITVTGNNSSEVFSINAQGMVSK